MYISERVRENLQRNQLQDLRAHCFYNQYDAETNPGGIIALAVAENKLMHPEIAEHITKNFRMTPWMLTYGQGPGGSTRLRKALATFVNTHFRPWVPVDESAICVNNGTGSSVSDMAFCIGEPGEGILVGRPLYVGFFPDIQAHAKMKAVLVELGDANPTSADAVSKYEIALHAAEAQGTRIRAILLANPHNPLGRPYDREALIGYLQLCSKYNIHLISDEVYVKSIFPSNDIPHPPPFLSILSIDVKEYIDPSLVHVLYGMSKDFCANGVRIGSVISPFNPTILKAVKSITSFSRPSSMAELAWLNLMEDEKFLDWYFPALQHKMTEAYNYCTSVLKQHGVPYTACSAASFIWLDLSHYLHELSVEAEMDLAWRLARNGVWVAMGQSFGSEKYGNFRLTFATPEKEMKLGMERLVQVLKEVKREKGEHDAVLNSVQH